MAHLPPDDPEARKLLTDCAAELGRMAPVSFSTRYATAGAAMVIDGKADIRFVRNAVTPDNSTFFGKGRLQMPALNTPDFFVWRYLDDKGKLRVAYEDDNAKAVIDRPEGPGPDGKETDGNKQMGLVLRSMVMPAFISPAPFADELKAPGGNAGTPCVFLPDEKIGEETCKVVRVIFKQGAAERKIWISPTDKLPRKYEQFRNGLSRYWELTDFKKLTGDDAARADKVKVPDGYRLDKQDIGGKVDTTIKDPPMQPVAAVPMGGPAVGQIAPDWDLKGANGQSVSLKSLQGQTVVVTFGGSMFPQSWSNQAEFAKSLDAKSVKVVAIACRESDSARASKAFTEAHGVGTLLTGGDDTAALYNVRGFPSTVVIGPDGKVKAFFESSPKAEDVAAAAK
ncbi:MAG: redoxin domain-containing protein [Phycisphaerales bacterium]